MVQLIVNIAYQRMKYSFLVYADESKIKQFTVYYDFF